MVCALPSGTKKRMSVSAEKNRMSDSNAAIASRPRRPMKKPCLARGRLPAPVFCATKTEIASAPLSPTARTIPSTRVVAV